MNRPRRYLAGLLAALGLAALALALTGPATASSVTLVDHNNSVVVDYDSLAPIGVQPPPPGIYGWLINGRNNLQLEWFWFRYNEDYEQALDGTTFVSVAQSAANKVTFVYEQAGSQPDWMITVALTLTGSPVGDYTGDLSESISITNLTDQTINFAFFEYSDFDLVGSALDTTATLMGVTPGIAVTEVTGNGAMAVTAINGTRPISRYELAYYPTTIGKLIDGDLDNLSSVYAPGVDVTLPPGDVTWAVQWNLVLAARSTFQLTKGKLIMGVAVPEPSGLVLAALGLPLLLALRRRRG